MECAWLAGCTSIIDYSARLFAIDCFRKFTSSSSHVQVMSYRFDPYASIYNNNIYFHFFFSSNALHRAVCGRIETAIQGLPPPYHLNKPKFALVTSAETRNQIKAPNFGINWTLGYNSVEIVNSLTGKIINNKISRITKQNFFSRYANLVKQLPNIRISRNINKDYSEVKASVHDYQVNIIKLN